MTVNTVKSVFIEAKKIGLIPVDIKLSKLTNKAQASLFSKKIYNPKMFINVSKPAAAFYLFHESGHYEGKQIQQKVAILYLVSALIFLLLCYVPMLSNLIQLTKLELCAIMILFLFASMIIVRPFCEKDEIFSDKLATKKLIEYERVTGLHINPPKNAQELFNLIDEDYKKQHFLIRFKYRIRSILIPDVHPKSEDRIRVIEEYWQQLLAIDPKS